MRALIHLITLALCLLPAACAWGPGAGNPDFVGLVAGVQGEPRVIRGSVYRQLATNSAVNQGDTLLTGLDERLEVLLEDGSSVILNGASQLTLKRHDTEGEGDSNWTLLDGGLFISHGRSIARGKVNLVLETPIVHITASGQGNWKAWLDSVNVLEVCLLQPGNLQLQNEFGSITLKEAGTGASIGFSAAPDGHDCGDQLVSGTSSARAP